MWGRYTPTAFYATPPPLSLWQKISGPQGMKTPQIGPSNRLRKSRGAERRIIVNRDAFRKVRFGLSEVHRRMGRLIDRCVGGT